MSGTNHFTTFVANDRTGDLQNLKFTDAGIPSFLGGKKTLFQVIHYCMRQLNMDMGYRIAIDLFEDSHTKTSGNDPLRQTSVDTDSYFKEDSSWSLQNVMLAILTPFKARLVGWGGYWYIEDQELKLTETNISYVEFDADGSYVGTGSYSHLLDFKGSTESDRFRWVDKPKINTTEVYKDVELELDVQLIPALTPEFIYGNVQFGSNLYIKGFKGFKLVRGNTVSVYLVDEDNRKINAQLASNKFPDDKIGLVLDMEGDLGNSNTYLRSNTTIEYGAGDAIKMSLKADVQSPFIKSANATVRRGGIVIQGS
jgi:hypothetical protein